MFCSKCGENVVEGTAFCPKCGNPVTGSVNVDQEQPAVTPAPVNAQKMTRGTIVLIVVSVIVFIPWMLWIYVAIDKDSGGGAFLVGPLFTLPILTFPILLLINKNQKAKIIGGIFLAWWLASPFISFIVYIA